VTLAVRFDPPGVPAEHLPMYRLEAALRKLPQVDCKIDEDFCDGLYARTMHIPAGTVATGAVHSKECFLVVRYGELLLTTDDGVRPLKAGDMVKSRAGTKRAAAAVSDCAVTTFHGNPSNEHDAKRLWELFTLPEPGLALEGSR
jgi:hypothetical protein